MGEVPLNQLDAMSEYDQYVLQGNSTQCGICSIGAWGTKAAARTMECEDEARKANAEVTSARSVRGERKLRRVVLHLII